MSALLRARYVGRASQTRDLLLIAERHLQKTEQDVALLVGNARARLARRLKRIRDRAIARGTSEGRASAQVSLAVELLALHRNYQKSIKDAEADCAEFCFNIVQQFLEESAPNSGADLAKRVHAAVQEVGDSKVVHIEVHPDDVAEFKDSSSGKRLVPRFKCVENHNLARGDAAIVTAVGTVHIEWRHQFEEIRKRIREKISKDRV